ncbi:F0F1 ATP synthase subunit delta [Candidatus Uhrbacteria bacterium]|nr:F0F1 ATP synthase subunit delta [Candidatus Uhrbacteria bacterium]
MKLTNKQLANVLFEAIEEGKKIDVSEITDAFVKLIAQRGELRRIPSVIQSFEQLWKSKYGAATVTIETAHQLSASFKKRIGEIATGAEIREIVNENLIGGAKLKVDDRVIDGSISGALQQLKVYLSL